LGEVISFNENKDDITGRYTNVELELEVEKERLKRYQEMYDEAKSVEDKLNLNDRIFNQERRIKYLEDSMKNMDTRIDYSTISVSLQEKKSSYVNVVFVKFSQLIRSLVDSINSVLKLVFWILPWALLGIVVWLVVRVIRKR
jgi:predicted  nucleic acid-binding Zn-ribbon protein